MISNAKDKLLTANPGTLPDMSNALANWFQTMTFKVVTKTIVDSILTETTVATSAQGVRQPMQPQLVNQKPEGQRAWKWQTIHAWPSLILSDDDIVVFDSVPYRVSGKLDWKEYGYVEYHIYEDYTT